MAGALASLGPPGGDRLQGRQVVGAQRQAAGVLATLRADLRRSRAPELTASTSARRWRWQLRPMAIAAAGYVVRALQSTTSVVAAVRPWQVGQCA